MNTCIIGLGSNIDPQKHIHEARKILGSRFKILKESKFVSTKPVGVVHQSDFLNGALFGLIVYGVYNAANYSLLKDWPISVALIDTLWGTALCGVVAVSAYMVDKIVNPR